MLLLSSMMLPGQVTMIPVFVLFRNLGWYNSLKALTVPAFLGGGAFNIFLLRQFFMGIPNEIIEAAKIDGCSYWGIYWRIMLPLGKPALTTVALFTFIGTWNDFMSPLIYLQDQSLYTIALGLQFFQSLHSTEYALLMAAALLTSLPIVILLLARSISFAGKLEGTKGYLETGKGCLEQFPGLYSLLQGCLRSMGRSPARLPSCPIKCAMPRTRVSSSSTL